MLGRYKLIEFFEDNHCELYDIEPDLSERNNIAAEHPEKVETMRAMLHRWQQDAGAKFPSVNPDWNGED